MSSADLSYRTPEYMHLPKMRFKLKFEEFRNDESLKTKFMDIIKRKNMAPYYEDVCKEFNWEIDEALLNQMSNINASTWEALESSIIHANLKDLVKGNWEEKFGYACEIGDFDRASNIASSIFEDENNSPNSRVEAAFGLFRITYLKNCFHPMAKIITELTSLMEGVCKTGSDWCCRNKLKVYEALHCLATRNFPRATVLLLDCIPTFESYELLTFKELVEYTVLSGIISLSRAELDQKFNKNGVLKQALLMHSPRYKEYLYSLCNCHYTEFFHNLAWIESEIKFNPLLHLHYRYYAREMRLKAYSQILQAYRTLGLNRMAIEFGVTEQYIEQEIARFIFNGKLHCKIDKVSGAIITVTNTGCVQGVAPDISGDRGLVYQNTIKRGDALLNRLKKLGQIIEF